MVVFLLIPILGSFCSRIAAPWFGYFHLLSFEPLLIFALLLVDHLLGRYQREMIQVLLISLDLEPISRRISENLRKVHQSSARGHLSGPRQLLRLFLWSQIENHLKFVDWRFLELAIAVAERSVRSFFEVDLFVLERVADGKSTFFVFDQLIDFAKNIVLLFIFQGFRLLARISSMTPTKIQGMLLICPFSLILFTSLPRVAVVGKHLGQPSALDLFALAGIKALTIKRTIRQTKVFVWIDVERVS